MAKIFQLTDKKNAEAPFYPVVVEESVLDKGGNPIIPKLRDMISNAEKKAETAIKKAAEGGGIEKITYSTLKAKRDGGTLVAGKRYRITDYECTTSQNNTRSAGHRFDVIVEAVDSSTLSEVAGACKHDGDSYFADAHPEAWQIWYCLDNDGERFAWASSSGKGVIYRMIDEWNNDCPYDFKNIQFKRFKITAFEGFEDSLVNKCVAVTKNWPIGATIDTNIFGWYYTFSTYAGYVGDKSRCAKYEDGDPMIPAYDNKIECCRYDPDIPYQMLNNITFIDCNDYKTYGNKFGVNCHSMCFVGYECYSNTFGERCYGNVSGLTFFDNTFGSECYENTFGKNCFNNKFEDYCSYNTFGNSCSYNTFENYCEANAFKNGCSYNKFGDGCCENIFENNCRSNTFGNECYSNTFGKFFSSNKFGNECYENAFGDYCASNTFGDCCCTHTFGNDCSSNTFGDYCSNNTFGNECRANTFGSNCYSNKFGTSSSTKDYMRHISLESGVSYTYINCTATTSGSMYGQNIHVCSGVRGTNTTRKTLEIDTAGNDFLTTFRTKNDQTIFID